MFIELTDRDDGSRILISIERIESIWEVDRIVPDYEKDVDENAPQPMKRLVFSNIYLKDNHSDPIAVNEDYVTIARALAHNLNGLIIPIPTELR